MDNNSPIENRYFELRGYSKWNYDLNIKLPKYLVNHFPKNKDANILDIGCGQGRMLMSAKNDGFSNLLGIDISLDAVDQCKSLGLNAVHIRDVIEFAEQSDQKYDFIIMAHVLEHVDKDKIIATLIAIKKMLLKPDGKLFIAVPNAQSNTNAYWRYEDFTHSILFTSGSMKYVLQAAGFNTISFINKDGVDGQKFYRKWFKLFFIYMYKANYKLWNFITDNHFHSESPAIFTWELRVISY